MYLPLAGTGFGLSAGHTADESGSQTEPEAVIDPERRSQARTCCAVEPTPRRELARADGARECSKRQPVFIADRLESALRLPPERAVALARRRDDRADFRSRPIIEMIAWNLFQGPVGNAEIPRTPCEGGGLAAGGN